MPAPWRMPSRVACRRPWSACSVRVWAKTWAMKKTTSEVDALSSTSHTDSAWSSAIVTKAANTIRP